MYKFSRESLRVLKEECSKKKTKTPKDPQIQHYLSLAHSLQEVNLAKEHGFDTRAEYYEACEKKGTC